MVIMLDCCVLGCRNDRYLDLYVCEEHYKDIMSLRPENTIEDEKEEITGEVQRVPVYLKFCFRYLDVYNVF